MKTLRLILFIVITLNLLMIAVQVFLYPPLATMPGALVFIAEPIILLLIYALIIGWFTWESVSQRADGVRHRRALVIGTQVGLVAALLEMVHISVENFGRLDARSESISTGTFMIGLFLLWGAAGYLGARRTGSLFQGLLSGCWSAMMGMLLTMTFGLSQLFWSLPRLEQRNTTSPDFFRSGWTDLHAFTIADLFQAGAAILLIAPMLAIVFGGVGSLLGRFSVRRR